ncbi:MAG: hypothetical protein RLZZ142_1704 [Verrucomicrobiota bacterium]
MKFPLWLIVWSGLWPLGLSAAPASPVPASVPARHSPLLKEYCQGCHGAEKQKGKFRVDDLPLAITTLQDAERWQNVLNQMNSGEMPPEEEKQPPKGLKADLLEDLAQVMVSARRNLSDQKGTITMRRLNRREYKNTLRELLGVDVQVLELPPDGGAGSFDTVGSNLFMSGSQFEQYLALGRVALEEVLAKQAPFNGERKLRREVEELNKEFQKTYAKNMDMSERAERWAKAVEEAAARPENAALVAEIRKEAKSDDLLRQSWAKIPGAPSPAEFGFDSVETSEGLVKGANVGVPNRLLHYRRNTGVGYMRPYHEAYLRMPALESGAYLTVSEINPNFSLMVPQPWPPGEYVLRVRVAALENAPPERRFLDFGNDPIGGRVLSTHSVSGTLQNPQVLEIPFHLTGNQTGSTDGHIVNRTRTFYVKEKGTGDHYTQSQAVFGKAKAKNGVGPDFALWVDWIEIEAVPQPQEKLPPGLAALSVPLDDRAPLPSSAAVRESLKAFCVEAFRGTEPPESYLDRLLRVYALRLKGGAKHSAALREALATALASPMFLYLAEPSEDAERRPLNGPELATRLSYFLWGAPPDPELRELGVSGALRDPRVLREQTERLLRDPRSSQFVRPFLDQWLVLERLDFFEVNRTLYPRFDNAVKLAARQEVYETFADLLAHNGSLGHLLKSDSAVLNSVLADFYGIPGVTGDGFRRVSLPKDSPRGGLLGMAAVHVMGGNGERTSPVERGAWVLRKLLNDPPPPAPANVPQIARLAGKVLTTKERLQAHQEEPQCMSCHRKIDPIGFGLENFDAVGQWRTEDSYTAVDANGKPDPKTKRTWAIEPAAAFYKGPPFQNYGEFRDRIAERVDAFGAGFSKALIEYALGRPCGFSDEALLERIQQQVRPTHWGLQSVLHALIASPEFQSK